jgi:hypothetical protein
MRDCPVAVRVIEGQEVGLGVVFTQPSDPFTSERRPGAAALQPDLITAKSHRCVCGAIQFSSAAIQFWSGAIPFSRRTIRFSSDAMVVPRSTMGSAIVSLRLAERDDWRERRGEGI